MDWEQQRVICDIGCHMKNSITDATLPQPIEVLDVVTDDLAVIRLRRHGNPSGPRVMMSHGNGCAIDGYYPYWRLFLEDFDLVLFDFRHYGQNPPHQGAHDFDRFLRDLGAIYDAVDRSFGEKPKVGAFHSMSARANLRYALEVEWRFAGLVVFDPPMVPPVDHSLHELLVANERTLWRWSETRREEFDDPAELAAHFAGARMLSGWDNEAYMGMARAVLRRDADMWRLSCPGPLESAMYRQNAELFMWPHATDLPGPVALIASDPEGDVPSAPGHSARALRDERGWYYRCVPGTGHFLQIQEPEACRDLTLVFMREIGFL